MSIQRFVHCYLLIFFVLCEIYFLTSVSCHFTLLEQRFLNGADFDHVVEFEILFRLLFLFRISSLKLAMLSSMHNLTENRAGTMTS
jgi:hypothetical protein